MVYYRVRLPCSINYTVRYCLRYKIRSTNSKTFPRHKIEGFRRTKHSPKLHFFQKPFFSFQGLHMITGIVFTWNTPQVLTIPHVHIFLSTCTSGDPAIYHCSFICFFYFNIRLYLSIYLLFTWLRSVKTLASVWCLSLSWPCLSSYNPGLSRIICYGIRKEQMTNVFKTSPCQTNDFEKLENSKKQFKFVLKLNFV